MAVGTTTVEVQGRHADLLVSDGPYERTVFARVGCVERGAAVVEMFTADELRELADSMDRLA